MMANVNMDGALSIYLKALYPNVNFSELDDLGIFLYAHSHRDPGVEFRALQQVMLQLKAAGLRGNRLRNAFVTACHEIAEEGAITNVTPHESTLLLQMCPPE